MRNRWLGKWTCMACMLGLPLMASGFGSVEAGAQASGSLGAFVARAEDPTAVLYNPAGLAQLANNELLFGGSGITSKSFYSNAGQSTWETDSYAGGLAHLFFNAKLGRVTLGFGTAPGSNWEYQWSDADFPSRFLANDGSFKSQEAYVGLGFKITDHFSLGASYRYIQADSTFSRVLIQPYSSDALFYEVEEAFEGDANGGGFIVGFQYFRGRHFSIGGSYQTDVDLDFSGTRGFNLLTRAQEPRAQADFAAAFRNADYLQTETLPGLAQIGLASRITVRTRIEVDLTYQDWSDRVESRYQTFDSQGNPTVVSIPRNWNESYSVRVAGDFLQRKAWLWRMAIATGDRFVPSQNVNPDLPNSDFFQYAFGFSYFRSDKYVFEAGLVYAQNRDREVEEKEFVFDPSAPNFITPNGQSGLIEVQRYELRLGMRIRFGASTKRN